MYFYSIIIPVFNRAEEVEELLASLMNQRYKNFEVIIVEDGSENSSEQIVNSYLQRLDIKYFYKENSGPGLSRNYGAERAKGEFFIFFDSDCLIPEHYLDTVNEFLGEKRVDAWGGPDREHVSFTPLQKAINYTMTSFLTTGGIRGGKKKLSSFHPRSFNMGISRKVFEVTGGFSEMRFGEDIDLSIRIEKNKFTSVLIPDAFVYHKRRTVFRKFFKQVYNSGIARINLYKLHPGSLKAVHFFPALFFSGSILLILFTLFLSPYFILPLVLYTLLIFIDALIKTASVRIALLSVISCYVQVSGYGLGFLTAFWKRIILKKEQFHSFTKTFYK